MDVNYHYMSKRYFLLCRYWVLQGKPDSTYAGLGCIGYLSCNRHDEEYPCLWVPYSLPHLVFLKVMILDPLSVDSDSVHRNNPFTLI